MSTRERLSAEDIAREDLIAVHHVHRYELAARLVEGLRVVDLCCGTGYGSLILADHATEVTGVDVDREAVALARRGASEADVATRVSFEAADAVAYVQRLEADAVDAVVCFEGIEHVEAPMDLAKELARLAGQGVRIFLSFPNSRAFEEENEFHVTDFGYDETLELLDRFDGVVLLRQYLAEGSLIVSEEPVLEAPLSGRALNLQRAEEEWANHYLAVVGVPAAEVETSAAVMRLAACPNYNSYLRALEDANRALRTANATLGQNAIGVHDAAAATLLARTSGVIRELEEKLTVALDRAERAERSAWENDQWLREERARTARLRRVSNGLRKVRHPLRDRSSVR